MNLQTNIKPVQLSAPIFFMKQKYFSCYNKKGTLLPLFLPQIISIPYLLFNTA
jgi:hypothetical protein